MYSTACHRQKHQTKRNPQQATQNQPTEEEGGGKKLKLPYLEIVWKKLIKYELQEKCQMMAVQAKGFNTFVTNT